MKTIVTIFLLALCQMASAQIDADGFRQYKIGTHFDQMSEGMERSKSLNPGFRGYEKTNEDFDIGGIEAHTIIYMFKKNLLQVVSIGIHNEDVEKAVGLISEKFGEPQYTETPFIRSFEWAFDKTTIVLSHFPTNTSEKSAAIGIRKR